MVQQLTAQAAWTDPDLRFWHYHDKDRVDRVLGVGEDDELIDIRKEDRKPSKPRFG